MEACVKRLYYFLSTSEELQATLAELADLQSQLADAHADNERLADEKQVLLESLCRQTEKLEDSRTKVDTLQELLMREGVEPETVISGDTDQQLFAVLKVSLMDISKGVVFIRSTKNFDTYRSN
ncbi:jg20873 [Pararge aegeria aegeria]|uniref:Jg20873 protein n=1 Tax=Pararge aegeria aegeria TaxID=348720 RepID=A0A8S4R6Y1_9NEOP|nr:jg20873 [Pararge aegeria aegeria]